MGTLARPHNRSGRQRWWITFQQPILANAPDPTQLDPLAEMPLTTWAAFGEPCMAEVEEIYGQKRIQSDQPQSEQRYRITCRWQEQIKPAMRIIAEIDDDFQKILNIESTVDRGWKHQELEIVAVETKPEE